jgi:hypothetical protein
MTSELLMGVGLTMRRRITPPRPADPPCIERKARGPSHLLFDGAPSTSSFSHESISAIAVVVPHPVRQIQTRNNIQQGPDGTPELYLVLGRAFLQTQYKAEVPARDAG